MAISAAVGTIAINRKKSARRRPKLMFTAILGPRRAGCPPAGLVVIGNSHAGL
jgi:hypothetical protein